MKQLLIASLTIALGVFIGHELISFKSSPNTYLITEAQIAKRQAIEECKTSTNETIRQINQNATALNQNAEALGMEQNSESMPELNDAQLEERCKDAH